MAVRDSGGSRPRLGIPAWSSQRGTQAPHGHLPEGGSLDETGASHAQLLKETQAIAGIGSYITDFRTGRWTSSEQLDAIFGIDAAFERSVEGWLSLVHPEDRAMMSEYLTHEVLGKGAFFDKEYRIIRRRDGAERWVHGRGRTSFDDQHQVLTLIGTIQDITERREVEAERAALKAQISLHHKAESLARMAGGMAHLFNNNLQAVMGNLDLMSELPLGSEAAHYAASARQATSQASKLSGMLLTFLGQTIGAREPRPLCDVCRGSLPRIQKALPEHVTLETECQVAGMFIQVHADLIQQVLPSLVFNAQEALGLEGGCIRIRIQACSAEAIPVSHRFPIGWQPEGSDYVSLEVRDEGCGIAEGDLENLFDPFFSTKFAGRGLGLSMVLGLVQAHGGAVVVESQLGQGSTFRVYLPSCPRVAPGPSQAEDRGAAPAGGETILLVDDDEWLLASTRELIEEMGFKVLTARDGLEGVEIFLQHRDEIHCVITDIVMPRMDGWGTLQALRQLAPELPVIMVSGYDHTKLLADAHPACPQAFLGKPFGLQQLRDTLEQVLGTRGRGGS